MWIPFMLSCLQIVALDVDWTVAQKIAPCSGSVYVDCYDYCARNCGERGTDCFYHCENGCGCDEESFIVRNNGACIQLMQCLFDEDSDEEEGPTPK
ncbi:hypothetical protein KR044_007903, partial [Drosophila immigrans]